MNRSGGTLRLQVDPEAVSVSAAIRSAAQASPLELGGVEGAAEYLHQVAQATGRPIAVNLVTGADSASTTAFVSPRGWTQERLDGWVAGHHQELEAEFGPVQRIGPNRAARRRRQRED